MNDKPKYNPEIHHRRSIRLKGYDYSQAGLYFVTICVQDRACLFGNIENRAMKLNDAGRMVEMEWLKLTERFQNIVLHEYVVMPNHFHAILEISVGAALVAARNIESPNNVTENNGAQYDTDENNGGRPQGHAPTAAHNNTDAQNNGVENNVAENNTAQNHGEGGHKGTPLPHTTNKTVGDMVGAFQSIVTVEYIRGVNNLGWPRFNGKLLQRNYYEHIIRDEQSYQTISDYISNNPANWADDKFFIK